MYNVYFCSSSAVYSIIIDRQKHALRKTAYLPNQTCLASICSQSQKKGHINPNTFYITNKQMTKNNALLWLHQVKLCRFFRYSAFRGWHRSDCALLALSSPKFSVKQHRSAARDLLFFCKSAEYLLSHSSMGGICVEGHVEFVFSLVPKHCRE